MGQDVGQGEGTDKESCLVPPPLFFLQLGLQTGNYC